MNAFLIVGFALAWLALVTGAWLGWQLLRQNGRMLLRLDELERRLDALQFGDEERPTGLAIGSLAPEFELPDLASETRMLAECLTQESTIQNPKSEIDQSLVTSAATSHFKNHSLNRSKLKRDGLKAGTLAPDFRLPRLDGRGEFTLSELRGREVLLVFSNPACGPCNALAPQLEKFHREHREVDVVMISKGEPKENCRKVKEHGLTFLIALQQHWEISRRYAMFATPIAYFIDESGTIAHDVAVGSAAIVALFSRAVPNGKLMAIAPQKRQ
jgi:peroxiredoxin